MNLDQRVAVWHQAANQPIWRAIAFTSGILLAGSVMWDPTLFTAAMGELSNLGALSLVWACCSAMIYGVGFSPKRWYWQLAFSPYISSWVLGYFLLQRFVV
ncbi:cyd operon YbgE family protein [Thaumasiovibrio sp. DFM-14]|uniref:cyd operon YbgE family protein n=1 Tax=Thaumasiovibrio sp. DFM-14 TaxID=3384792 RepID=UPI0039A263AF